MNNLKDLLINWYRINARNLPWRNNPLPYNIWVSEIILQQTQMSRGVEYYQRFIQKFPEVTSLASADEHDVMLLWQGLGYYSRARNMLATAKEIVDKFNAVFPDKYEELISLKGIGDYTACAILSIAYNKPFIVTDGNVLRVISRLFAIQTTVDNRQTVSMIKEIARKIMQEQNPAFFNQALMELGAIICKPKNPDCFLCPVSSHCRALRKGIQKSLPIKKIKPFKKIRYFHYFIFYESGAVFLCQRKENDIWKNLWEFPLIETKSKRKPSEVQFEDNFQVKSINRRLSYTFSKKHILTHQTIHAFYYVIPIPDAPRDLVEKFTKANIHDIHSYPVHNLMKWAIIQLSERLK